jgi:dTDP-4-amino-4,6-dideoxygalactose transaminase
MLRELPPTAGLAPALTDLVGGRADLEGELAAFLRTSSVQLTCSASAGLIIAFEYLKTRSPGRTVIVPGYTCPLVVLAAAKAGLCVQPCDLQPGTFDLDLGVLTRLLTRETLCVVATHWGGALSNVAAIREAVRRTAEGVFVIEDAAQAFGASVHGAPVGFSGDIGVFSFAAGKGLTLFEGGALVSSSQRTMAGLREVAAALLPRDIKRELRRSLELVAYTLLYRPSGLSVVHGLPARYHMSRGDMAKALGDEFDDITMHRVGSWRTSFGARALRRFPAHLAAARDRFARLAGRLGTLPGVEVQSPATGENPSATYVILSFADPARADVVLRDGLSQGLGISRMFAFPLDQYPALSRLMAPASLPVAATMAACSVTVGTSAYMTQAEEDRVVELISGQASA